MSERRNYTVLLSPGCVCLSVWCPAPPVYLVLHTLASPRLPCHASLAWHDWKSVCNVPFTLRTCQPRVTKHLGEPPASSVKLSSLWAQEQFDSQFFETVTLSLIFLWYVTFWKWCHLWQLIIKTEGYFGTLGEYSCTDHKPDQTEMASLATWATA